MKNIYVKAAVQTLVFLVYITVFTFGYILLGESLGREAAQGIFYAVLTVVALGVIFMLNLARARFNSKD
jgi:hypothetical protein